MIEADIRGRTGIPEDVLTSICFGLLEFLGPTDVRGFLETAKNVKGEPPSMRSANEVSIKYWPPLAEGIPDLLVTCRRGSDERFYLIVEAKLGSPQSGPDQLERYYRSGQVLSSGTQLVYVTGSRTMPRGEIEPLLMKFGQNALVFWTSWYELYRYVIGCLCGPKERTGVEKNILSAIARYLETKPYVCFTGWPEGIDCLGFNDTGANYLVFYFDDREESSRGWSDCQRVQQYVRFYYEEELCSGVGADFVDYVRLPLSNECDSNP